MRCHYIGNMTDTLENFGIDNNYEINMCVERMKQKFSNGNGI